MGTDKHLVENKKTGAFEIKESSYYLPEYDIGDILAYKKPVVDNADMDEKEQYLESECIGLCMDVKIIDGKIETVVIYELEDGTQLFEDEVQYYWASNDVHDTSGTDDIANTGD